MSRLGAAPCALIAALLLCAAPARADVEPIGIDYSAPEGCPSADEFTTQVLERTDSARLSAEPGVRTFVVVISGGGTEVQGSLSIREPDGSASLSRTLSGSHCVEVAMALALATALAIDPQATFAPREDEPEPPPDLPPDPNDPIDRVEPPATKHDRMLGLAVGPTAVFGLAPVAGFGGMIAGELRRGIPLLATLGVELALTTAPSTRTAGAQSSYDLAYARPKVCAFPLPRSTTFRLLPCAGLEIGVLRARGSELPRPSEATRLWGAASVGPRLLWDLDDAWFVDLSGDVVLPFKQFQFVFENPETEIHQISMPVLEASLRFGARL